MAIYDTTVTRREISLLSPVCLGLVVFSSAVLGSFGLALFFSACSAAVCLWRVEKKALWLSSVFVRVPPGACC